MASQKQDDELERLVRNFMQHVGRALAVENGREFYLLKIQWSRRTSSTERIYKEDLMNLDESAGVAFLKIAAHLERLEKERTVKRTAGAKLKDDKAIGG